MANESHHMFTYTFTFTARKWQRKRENVSALSRDAKRDTLSHVSIGFVANSASEKAFLFV